MSSLPKGKTLPRRVVCVQSTLIHDAQPQLTFGRTKEPRRALRLSELHLLRLPDVQVVVIADQSLH